MPPTTSQLWSAINEPSSNRNLSLYIFIDVSARSCCRECICLCCLVSLSCSYGRAHVSGLTSTKKRRKKFKRKLNPFQFSPSLAPLPLWFDIDVPISMQKVFCAKKKEEGIKKTRQILKTFPFAFTFCGLSYISSTSLMFSTASSAAALSISFVGFVTP